MAASDRGANIKSTAISKDSLTFSYVPTIYHYTMYDDIVQLLLLTVSFKANSNIVQTFDHSIPV